MSSVDMLIYRPTEWILDVNNNSKSGLGHTVDSVSYISICMYMLHVTYACTCYIHMQVLIHSEPSSNPMDYYKGDLDVSAGDILGLMRFGDWADTCLAHLLTNRNFPSGLLGLANIASASAGQTGGICSTGKPGTHTSRLAHHCDKEACGIL